MAWLLLCCCAAALLPASAMAVTEQRPGVLILAHGGNDAWNTSVRDAVHLAGVPYPTDIAYGMGMREQEVAQIREAVARLQARGITELLVVPLLVSSHSEVYRQYEYLFGLRRASPWPHHTPQPLALDLSVRLSAPLDGHPYVAEVVLDRARHLSQDPAHEVVVLVAHGPNNAQDNDAWLLMLRSVALFVQQRGNFFRVDVATLRDDAPWLTRHQATQTLRRLVSQASRTHRVLVVPFLLARGGIEEKIPRRLHGLTYTFTGETLLPHPRVAAWIRDAVDRLVNEPAQQPSAISQPMKMPSVEAESGT